MPGPTINDVAAAAGVSKGAVSFALNGRPGVAPETRRRILEAADQLGWTPSPRARALSVSKALAVGLVVARPPEIFRADAFFPAFISGLETVLSEHGHALLLMVAEHDDVETYRRLAREGRVDGVVVTDLRVDDPRPALLAKLGLPSVVVGPELASDGDAADPPPIGVDDTPGIRAAVEHLVELGHTRIAHVSGPQRWSTAGRDVRRGPRRWLRGGTARGNDWVEADFSAESGSGRDPVRCSTCRCHRRRSSTPTT